MVEINGDNTFYPHRVTFWVFSYAYHLLSETLFHPISNFLEGLRMSLWVPQFFLPLRFYFDGFYLHLSHDGENQCKIKKKCDFELWQISQRRHKKWIQMKYQEPNKIVDPNVTSLNRPKILKLGETEHLTINSKPQKKLKKWHGWGKMYCHH